MRTLFFDIDGTLLITHSAGSGALRQAIAAEFGAEFGIDEVCMDVSFGGSTDRYLVTELLRLNGLPTDTATQGRLRRRYASMLRGVLAQQGGIVLPGVADLVERLSAVKTLRSAVMTGNFPETGRIKLEHFQLDRYFAWVTGGDLDAHRDDLARRAAEHLERMHGAEATEDVIVIGDTPKDVRCAAAIGASCLAVCTGGHGREELSDAGAKWVVDDLSAPETFDILTR